MALSRNFLNHRPTISRRQLWVFGGLFAAVGIVVLVAALAAGSFVAVETESGTVSNGANVLNDSGASGGKTVQFASAGTPTPSPSPGFNTCTNPTHTVAMDPNDPQAGISLGNFYLTNDTWNASGYNVASTMSICDYNNWYATVTEDNNAHDGAVKSYPNVHQDFNEPKYTSFNTISSSFAETSPHVGIYEWTYDIWLNGVADSQSTEIMIWHDNYGQTPGGSLRGTFTDSGHTWDVYSDGTQCTPPKACYIAFVSHDNYTSGTVNLKDFFNYITTTKGWLANTATIGQIDYGVEMVSTNGSPAKFECNNFSLTVQ